MKAEGQNVNNKGYLTKINLIQNMQAL